MLRKTIVVIIAATTFGGMALVPADAAASHSKWRGARFHGAPVYYPDDYAAPFYAVGAIYCWHWFRTGRGWARAWAC
jgi:hypothetical protein